MKITNILLIVVILVLAIILVGRFNFSEADFSLSNIAWNGMTQFSGQNNVNYLYAFSDMSSLNGNSTILIIGPTRNFSLEESDQAVLFMQGGGTIIVMDDFGTADSFLSGINSSIRLNQLPLCDDDSYYKRQSFPVITNILQDNFTVNVSTLYLNHPVAINTTAGTTVLAFTSKFGWIDANDNLRIDGNEKYDQYPVIASTSYGIGKMVVAGDPDLLINGMLDMGDNSVLASNILQSDTVYFDISHGQKIPPLATVFYIIKYDLVAQLLCSMLIILIGYAAYQRINIKRAILGPDQKTEPASKKRTIIDFMKAKLPVKERDINELDKKL